MKGNNTVETINLVPLILAAQSGDEIAMTDLLTRFDPLCIKQSKYGRSKMSEDCYQELRIHLVSIIYKFDIHKFMTS